MRVLFSCSVGDGHFLPLVPLARAFAGRGDDVAFATAAFYRDRVEADGFRLFPAGLEPADMEARYAPYRERLQQLPFNERRPFAFSWRFGRLSAPAKLPALLAAIAEWAPDLVVHESADLAAPVAAAVADVPSVDHGFGRTVPLAILELAARETDPLWEDHGRSPEPFGGVYRGTHVAICPPAIQGEAPPEGVRVERMRPVPPPSMGRAPGLLAHLPDRPTVYVTLGTVVNAVERFRVLLDALAEVDCNVVGTIGRELDPHALEPVPANAIVERYVPQAELLPHCAVAVAHGGSGSTLGALAHGVPLLLLPAAADQFENDDVCGAAGGARVLRPNAVDSAALRAEVETLLGDPSYTAAARGVAAEIDEMPSADEVADALSAAASATRPPS